SASLLETSLMFVFRLPYHNPALFGGDAHYLMSEEVHREILKDEFVACDVRESGTLDRPCDVSVHNAAIR
ncbi:hypothetical protein AVEN_96103-1, partial [Araneus ventricosus]